MKRFLHAGEGYVLFKRPSFKAIPCSSDTTLADNKRYRNKTTSTAYGSLVRPWFRQAAGILLVALVCLSARTGGAISRLLTGISSSFSRSAAEGLSKNSQIACLKPCPKRLWAHALYACLLLLLLHVQIGTAQESDPTPKDRAGSGVDLMSRIGDIIKPLQLGDEIPNDLWELPLRVGNHPEGLDEIRLSDYKGKLIILDFWATWCSVCLAGFPELDSLQRSFGESIQVLLVNPSESDSQVYERINKLVARNPDFSLPAVPLINGAELFAHYFPYSQVPHHIWIDPNGKVHAITYGDNTNRYTISKFLKDEEVVLEHKLLHSKFDGLLPFVSENNGADSRISSYTIFSNYISEVAASSQLKRDEEDKPVRLMCFNQSLPQLFATAYGEALEFSPSNLFFQKSRLVLEVNDTSRFMFPNELAEYRKWVKENTFCVDIWVCPDGKSDVFGMLKSHLEDVFPYKAQIENRSFPCWVLTVEDHSINAVDHHTISGLVEPRLLENREVKRILSFLTTAFRTQGIPFVSDHPPTASLTLLLDMGVDSPQEWDALFRQQGVSIRKEFRDLPVLVIKDI